MCAQGGLVTGYWKNNALPWVLSMTMATAQAQTAVTELGSESYVSIATGRTQPLNVAPAVATVITAEDLDSVGATTLDDAMRLVPGVVDLFRFQGDQYMFDGIRSRSDFNPEVLILVDGVPQTDFVVGDQRKFIAQVPLQSIARIEVMRGPGSALYGADALAGVINIITKTPAEVDGSEARLRVGAYQTAEGRALIKHHLGSLTGLFSAQVRTTDGYEQTITRDAQTPLDALFGTHASHAPGPAATDYRDYNLLYDLTGANWRARLRAAGHEAGLGAGFIQALDPYGKAAADQYGADYTYAKRDIAPNLDLRVDADFFNYKIWLHDAQFYPAGAFGGAFPNGVLDEPAYSERHARSEISGDYAGFNDQDVRLGVGTEFAQAYDIEETRNYALSPAGVPVPLGGAVELGPDQRFIDPHVRRLYYGFAQDEWLIARDWTLTAGLRDDNYSDFGNTVNPRLALVWDTRPDLTTKLLYGTGYRAPTVVELYARNNPSTLGNPNLAPVKIKTYQLAFDYRPPGSLRTAGSLFYHDIRDDIEYVLDPSGVTSTATNTPGQHGYGGEVEADWTVSRTFRVQGFYAYQHNVDAATGHDSGYAPHNNINLRTDWRFVPAWAWNVDVHWIGNRAAPPGDSQTPPGEYTLVDMTLRLLPLASRWSAAVSIFNIFDTAAYDPSEAGGAITQNYRLPGRSAYVEVRYDVPD